MFPPVLQTAKQNKKKKNVEHQTGNTGVEECDDERAGQKKKKEGGIGLENRGSPRESGPVQRGGAAGPSQQAAPLISLINRTKTTKQMGPERNEGSRFPPTGSNPLARTISE